MELMEFKQVLIKSAEELRNLAKVRHLNKVGEAFVNGQLNAIELLLVAIHKGETSMEKLQSDLVTQVVKLEDIEMRKRSSEIEKMITETVGSLRVGTAAVVNLDMIKYGHLSTKISQMKKAKKLDDNIYVSRRGEKVYLIKK